MTDRFDDYWQNFYIKQYNHWSEVVKQTNNPDAIKRLNEIKDILYKRWMIVFEEEKPVTMPESEKGYHCIDDCDNCTVKNTLCIVYSKAGKKKYQEWQKRVKSKNETLPEKVKTLPEKVKLLEESPEWIQPSLF